MAREDATRMFASAKEKKQKWVRQLQCIKQYHYGSYAVLPFVHIFFRQRTFHEIAVYCGST